MQQAKGPREQTNHRDTKRPPKSEHRRVKVNLTVSARLTPFSIVQVQHTLAPCSPPLPQTSGALRKGIGHCLHMSNRSTIFSQIL